LLLFGMAGSSSTLPHHTASDSVHPPASPSAGRSFSDKPLNQPETVIDGLGGSTTRVSWEPPTHATSRVQSGWVSTERMQRQVYEGSKATISIMVPLPIDVCASAATLTANETASLTTGVLAAVAQVHQIEVGGAAFFDSTSVESTRVSDSVDGAINVKLTFRANAINPKAVSATLNAAIGRLEMRVNATFGGQLYLLQIRQARHSWILPANCFES
jgi:hypothetical protein